MASLLPKHLGQQTHGNCPSSTLPAWQGRAAKISVAPCHVSAPECPARPASNLAGRARRFAPLRVLAFQTDLVRHEGAPLAKVVGVRYRFLVPQYVTSFGQELRVVGSLPELGGWSAANAPRMTWGEGHQWSLECALPQESFEFKIIVAEGGNLKWEGGNNRVVQADEESDIPIEVVVWLTCHFDATTETAIQLAVPRANIQDAFETGRATLEMLKRRKTKMTVDADQAADALDRKRQAAELLRLTEAMVEQSTTVQQLGHLLGRDDVLEGKSASGGKAARPTAALAEHGAAALASDGSAEDEDQLLLLAIDSVRVPRALRRISFANIVHAGPAALSAGSGTVAGLLDGAVGPGATSAPAPGHSPFLRGELDSLAEDLMSAAGVLLQELQTGPDAEPAPAASAEWATLAEEAGHVAEALASLGEGSGGASYATQLQLQGLASVGSAFAANGNAAVSAEVTATNGNGNGVYHDASPADVDAATVIAGNGNGVYHGATFATAAAATVAANGNGGYNGAPAAGADAATLIAGTAVTPTSNGHSISIEAPVQPQPSPQEAPVVLSEFTAAVEVAGSLVSSGVAQQLRQEVLAAAVTEVDAGAAGVLAHIKADAAGNGNAAAQQPASGLTSNAASSGAAMPDAHPLQKLAANLKGWKLSFGAGSGGKSRPSQQAPASNSAPSLSHDALEHAATPPPRPAVGTLRAGSIALRPAAAAGVAAAAVAQQQQQRVIISGSSSGFPTAAMVGLQHQEHQHHNLHHLEQPFLQEEAAAEVSSEQLAQYERDREESLAKARQGLASLGAFMNAIFL